MPARRRRRSDRGADAARVSSRRLLCDPPAGTRLAVLPVRRPRARLGLSARCGRASSRRRHGRAARMRSPRAVDLGADTDAYRRLVEPLVSAWQAVEPLVLGPFPPPLPALRAAAPARSCSPGPRSVTHARLPARRSRRRPRALSSRGSPAHSMLPLERRPSAGFAIALAVPRPRGRLGGFRAAERRQSRTGSCRELGRAGGEVHTDSLVDDLPSTDVVLADVVPARATANRAPTRALRPRARPLPARAWRVQTRLGPRRADSVARSRVCARCDRPPRRDFRRDRRLGVGRLARPPGRAALPDPRAAHALRSEPRAGGEAHRLGVLPRPERLGRRHDASAVEAQVERFAPGFRELVLARHVTTPADFEARNRNLVGGDISGGTLDLGQAWTRPVRALNPYRTPLRGVYLCSAATPPGGGVHGMCGYSAALTALRDGSRRARRPGSRIC